MPILEEGLLDGIHVGKGRMMYKYRTAFFMSIYTTLLHYTGHGRSV